MKELPPLPESKRLHDQAKLQRLNEAYKFDSGDASDPERYNFAGENAQFLSLWASLQPEGTKRRLVYQYKRLPTGNVDGYFLLDQYQKQLSQCYICGESFPFATGVVARSGIEPLTPRFSVRPAFPDVRNPWLIDPPTVPHCARLARLFEMSPEIARRSPLPWREAGFNL